jgi:hypothetical protein
MAESLAMQEVPEVHDLEAIRFIPAGMGAHNFS